MLRSLAGITALLAALATASPALAEERASAGAAPRIGVGVSLAAFDVASANLAFPVATPADVYLSIDLGALRLEPSLGINRYSIDGGDKASSFKLGLGAFLQLKQLRAASIYAGGRVFFDVVSVKDAAGFSDSSTDFTLAGVLGAEWFADPRFSIGAEARLGFTVGGQLSDAGNLLRPGFTSFSTSGLLFLRFYL
jgi:hypothetical protein